MAHIWNILVAKAFEDMPKKKLPSDKGFLGLHTEIFTKDLKNTFHPLKNIKYFLKNINFQQKKSFFKLFLGPFCAS